MTLETDFEYEAQDRAEVLDETNLTEDGEDIANFDEIEDVFDVTAASDDDDDDEEDDAAFDADADPDAVDDELSAARDDEGADIERETLSLATASDGDGGVANDDTPEALEGDDEPAEDVDDVADKHVDRQLDKGLKETFPASDPVSINPGAD
ncbi:MAG: primosomal protein [Pseudomonadota bacterium]